MLNPVEVTRDENGEFTHPLFCLFTASFGGEAENCLEITRRWAASMGCDIRFSEFTLDAPNALLDRYQAEDDTCLTEWIPNLAPNEFILAFLKGELEDSDDPEMTCIIATNRRKCSECGARLVGKAEACGDRCRKAKSRKS